MHKDLTTMKIYYYDNIRYINVIYFSKFVFLINNFDLNAKSRFTNLFNFENSHKDVMCCH